MIPKYVCLLLNIIYMNMITRFIGYKSFSPFENASSKCNLVTMGVVYVLVDEKPRKCFSSH